MLFVVAAANLLGAAMALPQARKLSRDRRIHGVSVTWAAASITVNAWWIGYGLGVGDIGIVPVSVVSVMAYVVIVASVVRFSPAPPLVTLRPALAATAVLNAIPVGALVVADWTTTGIVLGALYGVQLAPAVLGAYRSPDVSGVSVTTWVIAFVEAALWGVYGAAIADVGLLALAATGVSMSSLVLARLFVRRPRRGPVAADALGSFATA